jgi:hypothetical protein
MSAVENKKGQCLRIVAMNCENEDNRDKFFNRRAELNTIIHGTMSPDLKL